MRGSSFEETVFRIRSGGSVSFGPPGCLIVCTDPDPSINKQKNKKNVEFYIYMQ
jgi:hypothetical protein